jgi:hypothetical protein
MSPEVQSEIDALRERVKRLELTLGRTKRGRTNQRGAADYLGKSREWLRQPRPTVLTATTTSTNSQRGHPRPS